ncbi:SOS response-associated peptidase [Asticcacaulis sp. AC460]|uniref:SOS response-associated peptidase n=1 Tax=Asticcacaulis sp. AC460 TaxID=1282360 RepID=UPI001F455C02|nr:SOS response-associated peptidase [Asticcacaulis sp. AC460]
MALFIELGSRDKIISGDRLTVVPTLAAPVIVEDSETGTLGFLPARFGLVPHWYTGFLKDWKASTFNARLEEADEKRTFHGPWRYRHCVVPAESFFEWSGPRSDRQKWRITRGDNQPLAFAGIWDEARTPEGDVFSFAILTRPAGPDMQAIHEREPVVLGPDEWDAWLRRRPVGLRRYSPLKMQNLTQQTSLF